MMSLGLAVLMFATFTPVQMEVTGYSNDHISINVAKYRDGLTATRMVAREGLCAADWDKHPPGTFFFIPGYGLCEVQDRGGAIKGSRIDLFFQTRGAALEWGRKKMIIYVLEGLDTDQREIVNLSRGR